MATKDSLRWVIAATLLLWFGLMFAPALLADEAWQQLEHPSLDALFASSNLPARSYAGAKLDAVSVWFPDDNVQAARHAEELRQLTSNYFEAAIAARGLTVTDSIDDSRVTDVVVVRVQLIDLRSVQGAGIARDWAKNFRFRIAAGRVTLVAELVDAATGQTVLRMADLQDGPSVDTTATIDRMLQRWGEIVAQNASALPVSPTLAKAR